MKIKLLTLPLMLGSLGLTSCNLNNEPTSNYQQIPFKVCNLVMPSQGDSFATPGNYTLTYYYYDGNMTVGTSDLSLGVGTVSFITSAMPYNAQAYTSTGQDYMEVITFKGGIFNENGLTVNNLTGYTSQIANIPPAVEMNQPLYPTTFNVPLVLQYDLNHDYKVKTFMQDATYKGKTTIRTNSTGDTFTNDGVLYRVYFKAGLNKADVVFYNAKFAENMPVTINFVLQDLTVNYTKTGYSISIPMGQTVIPQMLSKDGLTPFPSYQFSSFLLNNSSDDLTTATVDYWINSVRTADDGTANVVERYNGTFSGSYVQDGPEKEN